MEKKEHMVLTYKFCYESLQAGDYHIPYKVGELEIYFAPINYKEMNELELRQFEIQAKYKDITIL